MIDEEDSIRNIFNGLVKCEDILLTICDNRKLLNEVDSLIRGVHELLCNYGLSPKDDEEDALELQNEVYILVYKLLDFAHSVKNVTNYKLIEHIHFVKNNIEGIVKKE